ncbi:MAG: DUF3298 domain-containing protein [Oscillospiraceae bacterium]|nr:DUF3298 domain-containing protein [Oscillospiraceae bacterium]
MKKCLIAALLLCLLLTACAREEGTPTEGKVPTLTDIPSETTGVPGDGLIRDTQPPERMDPAVGQAGYSLLQNDNSIRNASGDILVKIQYDQVILDTAQERWQPINDRIGADYRGFLEELAYLQDTPPAQWEQMLQDMGAVYGNFLATCTPEVTCNGGDIFSIRMTRDWFLGGVYNRDYYGLNFDLTTGEELPLSRLSPLPEEAFLKQLKEIVSDALADNRDALFEDPAVILEDFTLADFSYCIEDGELVLLFPTYTFGPGVLGATEIATGLYPSL